MCVLENDTEFVTCIRGIVFLEQSVDFVCFEAKEADDAEKVIVLLFSEATSCVD